MDRAKLIEKLAAEKAGELKELAETKEGFKRLMKGSWQVLKNQARAELGAIGVIGKCAVEATGNVALTIAESASATTLAGLMMKGRDLTQHGKERVREIKAEGSLEGTLLVVGATESVKELFTKKEEVAEEDPKVSAKAKQSKGEKATQA